VPTTPIKIRGAKSISVQNVMITNTMKVTVDNLAYGFYYVTDYISEKSSYWLIIIQEVEFEFKENGI